MNSCYIYIQTACFFTAIPISPFSPPVRLLFCFILSINKTYHTWSRYNAQYETPGNYFHIILMVICICLAIASCHLSSIKHCQSASKLCSCIITFALNLTPFLAHRLSLLCVCGYLDETERGRPAVRLLHMFPIPPPPSSFADLSSPSPPLTVCLSFSMSTTFPSRLSISLSIGLSVCVVSSWNYPPVHSNFTMRNHF